MKPPRTKPNDNPATKQARCSYTNPREQNTDRIAQTQAVGRAFAAGMETNAMTAVGFEPTPLRTGA